MPENSSPNKKNISSQKNEDKKSIQKRNKSRKNNTTGESLPNSTQDIVSLEASEPSDLKVTKKATSTKIIDENNATNDRNEPSKQEKKLSKKSANNEGLGLNDEGDDENSKRKRRGWWSLKT